MKNVVSTYDERTIQQYSGLKGIRKRPTMYIEQIGPGGVHKLFMEIFVNSVDEFNADRCKNIWVEVDSHKNTIVVEDDGAGIPLGKLKGLVTELHMGGKFDETAYKYSAGLNGIGLKATNALSDLFEIDVYRDGRHVHLEYSRGEFVKEKEDASKLPKTGTRVKFHPDIEIFKDITLSRQKYFDSVDIISCINPGIRVHFTWDGKLTELYSEEGLTDYLNGVLKQRKYNPIVTPIQVSQKDVSMEMHASFTFASNTSHEYIQSYVNGLPTIDHGFHVTGLRAAISEVMKKFIEKRELLPKSSKLEITGDDIRETLVAIVVAKHAEPLFDKQTKDKFTSAEFSPFARAAVMQVFSAWCDNHSADAEKIAKIIIRSAKAREAAREAKEKVIKASTGGKSTLFTKINPDKFKDCKSNIGEECELFIVEGDSAGGSAAPVRDTDTQAIYKLRGKILNVFQSSSINDELTQLTDVLGCGSGDMFNIKKLRFHKIIFLTDADDDGGHISALLAGFFYKYFKPLIDGGHVYIAKPPLYRIKIGKKAFYIANPRHYEYVVKEIATKTFDLISPSKKVLSHGLFQVYLHKLMGYQELVESLSIQLNCVDSPELVEILVRTYDTLLKKTKNPLSKYGFQVRYTHESDKSLHLEIDRGYTHYCVVLDRNFEENIYVPLVTKLADVKLSNVYLQGKKTKKVYGGLTYYNARIVNSTIRGGRIEVSRFKGLGEMNPEELGVTAIHPATRNIVQIHIADADEAEATFDIYLGKNTEGKKRVFSE